MRVIETFVISVPRENIPADAQWFVQGPVTGTPLSIAGSRAPIRVATGWSGFGKVYQHKPQQLATDAAEKVVTREELMRAYDLVEQGYTLWFGGECPVEKSTMVDLIMRHRYKRQEVQAHYCSWSSCGSPFDTIAYRLSRSVDKDVAAVNRVTNARDTASLVELDHADTVIAAAIEKRIEFTKCYEWENNKIQICVNAETGYIDARGDNLVIITRAQWDDYVSRKIRVGDRVKTPAGNEVEVLFVTDKTALIRYPKGDETSIALENLTRISQ